jgi:large subunit ribosomal protein L4
MLIKVKNINNEDVKELELSEDVFNYELREHLIYEAVKNFRANQRRGTASTKTRGEVSGGGKKPWKQKGTGRARVGSTRNPLWRKGGTAFGPKPRDYSYNMPKKAKRNALKSVLSEKLRNDKLIVIDELKIGSIKTKEAIEKLKNFNYNKILIIDKKENEELLTSTRNIPTVKAIDWKELNIYDSLLTIVLWQLSRQLKR